MPIYIGQKALCDRYIGDKFVERVYKGSNLVFDAYNEITSNLPIKDNSRVVGSLKNYRIYGTAEGAGVETENLLINEPYKTGHFINENGQEAVQSGFNIYATKILDTSLGEYSFYFTKHQINTTVRVHGYSNGVWQQQIATFANKHTITITKPQGIDEIRISCGIGYTGRTLVEGSTAPSSYIPPGYKLPLTVETPNLVTRLISNCYINASGALANSNSTNVAITPIVEGKKYTILFTREASFMSGGFFTNDPQKGDVAYDNKRFTFTENSYTFIAPITGYLASVYSPNMQPSVFEGFTEVPIYIGNSKLGQKEYSYINITSSAASPVTSSAAEYIDYENNTIWKCYDGCYVVLHDAILKDGTKARFMLQPFFLSGWAAVDAYGIIYDKTGAITNAEDAKAGLVLGGDYTVKTSEYTDGTPYFLNITPIDDIRIWAVGYLTATKDGVTTTFYTEPKSAKVSDLESGEDIYSEPTPIIPANPPIPLPAIPTFKGENILSCECEVGKTTIKGRIKREPIIYGWHVDPSVSDPTQAITYLADATDKASVAMGANEFSYGDWKDAFFMPKPCMMKKDGTVAYYLNPNDYSKKIDGSASDVANVNFDGNAMMEWPLIWYKFEAGTVDGEGYFYCSDMQVDESYHCWCNYDANDNIIPHFYTSIYNQTVIDGRMRSLSGIMTSSANGGSNLSGQSEVDAAKANNTTSTVEWYTYVWSDRCLINALLILMGKSLDVQSVFGMGLVAGDIPAGEAYVTGTLDQNGLFSGSTTLMTQPVKVFGMENWWGHKWKRVAGMNVTPGKYFPYKLTWGTADGTTWVGYQEPRVDGYVPVLAPDGQVFTFPATSDSGNISKCLFGKHGFVPLAFDNSSDTRYHSLGIVYDGAYCLVVGGDPNTGHQAGLAFATNNAFVSAYQHIATGLSCKPMKK